MAERIIFDTYAYLVNGDQYFPVCRRCDGTGYTVHRYIDGGRCFDCRTRGTLHTKPLTEEQARKRAQQLRRSHLARVAKKEQERLAKVAARDALRAAFDAAHPEVARALVDGPDSGFLGAMKDALIVHGTLTEKQLAATKKALADRAARQAEKAARAATSQYVGHLDEKVTVQGKVAVKRSIEGVYGTSLLIVIDTVDGQQVKTFTTANWAWDASEGDEVALRGTVKKNEERDGVKTTVLTRCKPVK